MLIGMGVGPGLSPSPWLYCISHVTHYMYTEGQQKPVFIHLKPWIPIRYCAGLVLKQNVSPVVCDIPYDLIPHRFCARGLVL
jgi:hypothetical protein